MRKILSLVVGISGLFQIIFGGLMLAYIGELNTKTIMGFGRYTYAIFIIVFGIMTFWISLYILKNPSDLSWKIILAAFTINVIVLIINGWSNIGTFVSLIINAIGSLTTTIYLSINKLFK